MITKGNKFYMALYGEIFRNLLDALHRNYGYQFQSLLGVYVLNQFPSIVMLGMKGFHVSASEAIHGHHGPIVEKGHTTNNLVKLF